jgi:tRNA (adenine57-N1/adenine58-N1)-methyltransferase catalytic subunit
MCFLENVNRSSPENWVSSRSPVTEAGQLVVLVTSGGKRFLIQLQPGQYFHTHLGSLPHNDLIGLPLGNTVHSQLGHPMLLLEPSLADLMTRVRRTTQIIYPKDATYIVHKLNLRSGSHVIEAGTGSGALTLALAWSVAPAGMVYTYEVRAENFNTAAENLRRAGLHPFVKQYQESIRDGFHQRGVDAVFLDVRMPWHYLDHVRAALRPGGFFTSLVPTTNQVTELLIGLEASGFADIEVEELLVRRYKPVPDRLRPDDEMVGHTGFIISARPIVDPSDPKRWLSQERKRYEARKEVEAIIAEQEERRAAERDAGGKKYPRMPLPG